MTARATLLCWVALAILAGCEAGDDGDLAVPQGCKQKIAGDYYVGTVLPYTGYRATGLGYERGVVQALAEINEAGGLDGSSLGLVSCNSDGDQTVGTDVMRELCAMDAIGAVIGPVRSAVMVGQGEGDHAAAHEATEARTLLVSPSATSPLVADLDDDGYVFRTTVSDAVQGVILAQIAAREGFERVLVIQKEDDAYTLGIREVFVQSFDDGATQKADYVTFNQDQADFVTEVLDTADAFEPDAILLSTFTTNGAAIIREAGQRTWTAGAPRWMVPDGMKSDGLITKVGDNELLEGILGTNPASPTGADYQVFEAHHQILFDEDPAVFAANAYDAVYLIAGAMVLASDPSSGEQLKDAIWQTQPGDGVTPVHPDEWAAMLAELLSSGQANFEGSSGNVDFDDAGEVMSDIAEWTISDGVITEVGCWTAEGQACP